MLRGVRWASRGCWAGGLLVADQGSETMTVEVDQDLCIAAGRCVAVAPEVFDVDEDGFVVLLQKRPESAQLNSAHTAALVCPARAIYLSTAP